MGNPNGEHALLGTSFTHAIPCLQPPWRLSTTQTFAPFERVRVFRDRMTGFHRHGDAAGNAAEKLSLCPSLPQKRLIHLTRSASSLSPRVSAHRAHYRGRPAPGRRPYDPHLHGLHKLHGPLRAPDGHMRLDQVSPHPIAFRAARAFITQMPLFTMCF